jgi:hypothetical protein
MSENVYPAAQHNNPEDLNRHLADVGIDGTVMVKWILKEFRLRVWIWFICQRCGPVIGFVKMILNLWVS